MKRILLLFGLLFLIAVAIVFTQNFIKTNRFFSQKEPTATINNQTFKLMVAQTPKEKEIGLSEKSQLPNDQGMIFLFEESKTYPFWMKNMKIPIDIIYILDDEITTIISNAMPPQNPSEGLIIYHPSKPSNKVLEINGGLAERYNFKVGDKVEFENL